MPAITSAFAKCQRELERLLMANETTDMGDHCKLAIFARYIDSDLHEMQEEFLGIVEIVGSKHAKALWAKICNVCQEKGVNIKNMRFNGMDGTSAMSGKISGVQQHFCHITPRTKYMNYHNHKLALVFVHLLDQSEALKAVDTSLILVWKLMNYSSVKSAVYSEAQVAEGLKKLKLLKAAPTRWFLSWRGHKTFDFTISTIDRFTRHDDYEGSKTGNNRNTR